jgi:hypothetical protein
MLHDKASCLLLAACCMTQNDDNQTSIKLSRGQITDLKLPKFQKLGIENLHRSGSERKLHLSLDRRSDRSETLTAAVYQKVPAYQP